VCGDAYSGGSGETVAADGGGNAVAVGADPGPCRYPVIGLCGECVSPDALFVMAVVVTVTAADFGGEAGMEHDDEVDQPIIVLIKR